MQRIEFRCNHAHGSSEIPVFFLRNQRDATQTRGPWATSLFKSINIYDYHIYKPIIFFMRIEWFLIGTKLKPLSPKDALCQVWLKLTQWFW